MNPERIEIMVHDNEAMVRGILIALLHLSRKNYDAAEMVLTQSLPLGISSAILLSEKQSDETHVPPADE